MSLDLSALDDNPLARPPAPAAASLEATGVPARAALDRFEVDPDNPRFERDAAAFEDLVLDIKERGILQPIVVRRVAGGRLQIRFGESRYKAAVRLGLPDAPYVTTEDARQFDDYAQVAENARRSPLQPLELATFIAKKLAQGEKKKAVAARLRMDPSAVTHLLALVGAAPPWLLELYHGHRCRTPQYLYILRRLAQAHPVLVAERCARAAEVDCSFVEALTAECAGARAGVDAGGGVSDAKVSPGRARAAPSGSAGAKAQPSAPAPAPAPPLPGGRSAQWPPLARPKLQGRVGGRQVQLALHLRASVAHKAVVLFEDGSVDEVLLSAISLSSLGEAGADK